MHRLRSLLSPLRVLDAVCRANGVAEASRRLHITPGAVTQQLKQLESSLGVCLFVKSGRFLEPTTACRELGVRVAEAFDLLEVATAAAGERAGSCHLRIKVGPDFAAKWLVPRISEFHELHATIDLDIATAVHRDDFQLDDVDIVFRHGSGVWPDSRSDLVFMEELVPVCSPELARTIRTSSDLLNARLLHTMRRPEAWSTWFKSAGLPLDPGPRNMAMANTILSVCAAADGLGVAIAQRAFVTEDLGAGRIVIPVDHVARTGLGYYMVCRQGDAALSPLKEFREWIRSLSSRTKGGQ